MSKPGPAVSGRDATSSGARGLPKHARVTRRDGPDVFLRDRPCRLDGIEVRRVRRKKFNPSSARLDDRDEAQVAMSWCVVENHNVSPAKLRSEPTASPFNEEIAVGRSEDRAHGDPALETDRAEHREALVAPVDRTRIDLDLAAANPSVRATHRDICRGFVEKNELRGIDASQPPEEARTLLLNVRSLLFCWTYDFFLKT